MIQGKGEGDIMKRTICGLMSVTLCIAMLFGCAGAPAAPEAPTATQVPAAESPEATEAPVNEPTATAEAATPSEPDFTAFTTITTTGVLDFPMEFTLLPDAFNTYETEHKGTDMVIHYTTDVYGDGVTYEKFCRIYLPYGYDANDKDTKYNVIYFQHGHRGSPNEFFDHIMKSANVVRLFDNMFDPEHGVMEPCIIVCPTYYLEYDETSYMTPADNPAGDGRYAGIEANYHREVVEDLIPAVESQLNVYCQDFSDAGIKATRDHRAWAGYSRGSVCTFYLFHNDFEYFRYWMPMSATCRAENATLDSEVVWTDADAYQYLKETIDAHTDLPFFLFAASGAAGDAPTMRVQMKYFIDQTETFSYGLDPNVNNIYYTCSEFGHNDLYFPFYLYNARDVLFN
jgi:endo-1,4-beta-xylanase